MSEVTTYIYMHTVQEFFNVATMNDVQPTVNVNEWIWVFNFFGLMKLIDEIDWLGFFFVICSMVENSKLLAFSFSRYDIKMFRRRYGKSKWKCKVILGFVQNSYAEKNDPMQKKTIREQKHEKRNDVRTRKLLFA